MKKLLIIGSSMSGKSTLVKYLRAKYHLHISEIDEKLAILNGGTYPENRTYKDQVLVPKIITEVLDSEDVLFFSNALYFSIDDINVAKKRGFTIIQLIAPKEVLLERNAYRMEKEGYEDHSHWLDEMLSYQKEIFDKGLVDTVIDSDRNVEEIAKEFLSTLRS